jgi:hypothetical protein
MPECGCIKYVFAALAPHIGAGDRAMFAAWRSHCKIQWLAIFAAVVVVLIGPSPTRALADPYNQVTLSCHGEAVFTPTTMPAGDYEIVGAIQNSEPSIVSVRKGRAGGGTAGAITIAALGHTGDATITYTVRNQYATSSKDQTDYNVTVSVFVQCPPPDWHPTHMTHVVTNCDDCRKLVDAINKAIDAYNNAIDAKAAADKLADMYSAIMIQLKALQTCEDNCPKKTVPKRYPRLHIVVTSCHQPDCDKIANQLNADITAFNQAVDDGKTDNSVLDAMLTKIKGEADKLNQCEKACREHSSVVPPYGGGDTYFAIGFIPDRGMGYVSQNGTVICTFDDGSPAEVAYKPADFNGDAIATDTPANNGPQASTPGDDIPAGGKPDQTDKSPPVASAPPPPATAPPQDTPPQNTTPDNPPPDHPPPQTTDNPPPTTTVDVQTPPITVTVQTFEKVPDNNGQTENGSALGGQVVMLMYAKPDLMRTEDTSGSGSDRDPAKVTTDAQGHGVIHVRPDERTLYGLTSGGAKTANYRLELNDLKHSGGLADITGRTVPSDLSSVLPKGGQVATSVFHVGSHTYLRISIATPYANAEDLMGAFSKALGVDTEIDTCDTDKPADDVDDNVQISSSPFQGGLPSAIISLGRIEGRHEYSDHE